MRDTCLCVCVRRVHKFMGRHIVSVLSQLCRTSTLIFLIKAYVQYVLHFTICSLCFDLLLPQVSETHMKVSTIRNNIKEREGVKVGLTFVFFIKNHIVYCAPISVVLVRGAIFAHLNVKL